MEFLLLVLLSSLCFNTSIDKLNEKERRNLAISVVGISGTIALADVTITHSNITDPKKAFQRTYTDTDSCLDQSPFDPDTGATVVVRKVEGQNVLSTIPLRANSYTPSVLSFTYEKTAFMT